MSETIVAIGTIALVAVTGWYAVLTHRLAKSAEESARHSRMVAEAAARANVLQAAVFPVEFAVRMSPPMRPGNQSREHLTALTLTALGASIWLHSVEMDAYQTPFGSQTKWIEVGAIKAQLNGAPTPLQTGESSVCQINVLEGGFHATKDAPIIALRLTVYYSVERDSEILAKRFAVGEDGSRLEV